MDLENSQRDAPPHVHEKKDSLDEGQMVELCWRLYFKKGSYIKRTDSLKNRYDFEYWLKSINTITKISNVGRLIKSLPPNLSTEALEMEVARWLNIFLPR